MRHAACGVRDAAYGWFVSVGLRHLHGVILGVVEAEPDGEFTLRDLAEHVFGESTPGREIAVRRAVASLVNAKLVGIRKGCVSDPTAKRSRKIIVSSPAHTEQYADDAAERVAEDWARILNRRRWRRR